jgi:BMFP domain-containing protein YqiC
MVNRETFDALRTVLLANANYLQTLRTKGFLEKNSENAFFPENGLNKNNCISRKCSSRAFQ